MAINTVKLTLEQASEILPEQLQARIDSYIPRPLKHGDRIIVNAQGTRADGKRGEITEIVQNHSYIGVTVKPMLSYMLNNGLTSPLITVTFVSGKWFPRLKDYYRVAVDIIIE